MSKSLKILAIAVFAGMSTGACTSSTTDTAPPVPEATAAATPAGTVDTSVFRGIEYDYMVFESPEDLAGAKDTTAVFTGDVEGFSQGRVVSSPGLEEKHVVMKVSLSETFKGPRDGDGFAYVELPQPTCAGDVPCATVADFTAAVPAGTKVLVFGEPAPEAAPPGGRLLDDNAGRPAGARLIRPHPQGLLFESATATGATVVGAYEEVGNMPEAWRKNPSAGIGGLTARLRTAKISD
ncbi:hypothetical protein [Actinoplanes xinjiangensis]|uniref:hypothetical protein n=1 Tax=Actinoplanes xinjiangensis TaxID=512350 RepID=UPI0034330D0E